MKIIKHRRLFEGEQQAQPQQNTQPQAQQQQAPVQQQQPAQQPAQAQAQPQQQPQQQAPNASTAPVLNQEAVNNFKNNLAKQIGDITNKVFQDELNGSSPISNLLKTNAEAKKYVDQIIAQNNNFDEKSKLVKGFLDTLDKTVGSNQQPVQQPSQQPQQPAQAQQPQQQNESYVRLDSFVNRSQSKLV